MIEPAATAEPTIDLTAYENVRKPIPVSCDRVAWSDFVRTWVDRGHPQYPTKDAAPLWSPHRLRPGASRSNDAVLTMSACVFDLDGGAESIAQVLRALDGFAYLAHSTYSSKEEHWKARVIVPFSEPVLASAWRPIGAALRAKFAPSADPACSDPARQFYVPSVPPGGDGWILVGEGRALLGTDISVQALLAVPAPDGKPRSRTSMTETALQRLCAKLRKAPRLAKNELGERLNKILLGEAYAEHGERDTITWELCKEIARAYPDAEPASIASFFERSLSLMPDTKVDAESVIDKITRAQAAALEKDTFEANDHASRTRGAFGGPRATPYVPSELQAFADVLGVDREDLHRYWLLMSGPDVYVLTPGPEYRLLNKNTVGAGAFSLLAPVPAPFSLFDDDNRPKTGETLLREYGTPIDGVVRSLYDATPKIEERKLILPSAPIREMVPTFDPEIAEWLRLLAGDAHEDLLRWLGLSTNLKTPLPALVMIGDKGSGKSLLAAGLARLWTKSGPTTLDQALSQFNDRIETCPLVFGDEHVPRDNRGNVRTEELRALIQAVEHHTNRKHRADGALRGAVRVVIAANNQAVIELRGHLTKEDVDAIAERLFYVEVTGRAAAQYLETIGGRTKTEAWVAGDGIARHVLSLTAPPVTSRFGFLPARVGVLARRIAVRSGPRAQACEWIVRALIDGFKRPRAGKPLRVGDSLILPTSLVYDGWGDYLEGERPALSVVAGALGGVSLGELPEGQVIDLDMLRAWAHEHGYTDEASITGLVERIPE